MIDLIASEPQYLVHLAPLWDALPDRGIHATDRTKRTTDAALVASGNDLRRAKRLGYRRIAYLEHGIGQTYGNGSYGYPGGRGRDAVGLFLSPNATAAAADQKAYPSARVVPIGDPRLDTLPHREPGPPCIAISFHWSAMTFKPWPLSAFSHYKYTLPELRDRFPLIGHCHPKAERSIAPLYRRLMIEYVPDFDEVCRRADLYIADNTSTLYEFASTGRPVVVLNAPWFRKDTELGLRFWEASQVGWNVDEPEDLVNTVGMALAAEEGATGEIAEEFREAALDVAYAYRSGAAQRGAAAVMDWLGARAEVAA